MRIKFDRRRWPGNARNWTMLSALLVTLVAGSCLLAKPVLGRWEVPATNGIGDQSHSSAQKAISLTSTPTPVARPEAAEVPILMYHYVSDLPADANTYRRDLTVSPEAFRAQLEYLKEADYRTITLTDLHLHLTESYPLPEKPVILTFDDGYRDAYEVVFPLLLDYGFTGTFFVLSTPAHHESPEYLTWDQMNEMARAGMSIQSHGRDHVDLRNRSYEYLVYQTLGIQEAIEQHTDIKPRFFCYPGGKRDANVIKVLESAGYWGAVTTEWGQTHTREDFYEMPRLRVRGTGTLESFIKMLEGD